MKDHEDRYMVVIKKDRYVAVVSDKMTKESFRYLLVSQSP